MLEAPQATTRDANPSDPITEAPDLAAPHRSGTRSYRDGYSDFGIDKLDLSFVETTASADGAFAARLERAIEDGLERDVAITIDEPGTERPMAMIMPSVPLPEQIPATPQRATFLAYRLARQQRRETTAEQMARAAETGRWLLDLGTLTLMDLRAGVCHFSTSEASPYFFCGAGTGADAKKWCAFHDRVCHESSYPQS